MENEAMSSCRAGQKVIDVKPAFRHATAVLEKGGNHITMILSSLFCLLAFYALYIFAVVLNGLLGLLPFLGPIYTRVLLFGYETLLATLLIFFVLPAFSGYLRLAGLMLIGENPLLRQMLYYYHPTRLMRGVGIGLCLAFAVGVPAGLVGGGFSLSILFYEEVMEKALGTYLAILPLAGLMALSIALGLLGLFLVGFFMPAAAIAAGNETLSLREAILRGVAIGRRNLRLQFAFSRKVLWHLLVSAFTCFILWLLYYGPQATIAYLHQSMMMDLKGDFQ